MRVLLRLGWIILTLRKHKSEKFCRVRNLRRRKIKPALKKFFLNVAFIHSQLKKSLVLLLQQNSEKNDADTDTDADIDADVKYDKDADNASGFNSKINKDSSASYSFFEIQISQEDVLFRRFFCSKNWFSNFFSNCKKQVFSFHEIFFSAPEK